MNDNAARVVLDALVDGPRYSLNPALDAVPRAPGLYAIYGDARAIAELATGGVDRALYVGKAEHSLAGRDIRTHFATGRTGSSTLRRSVAALLRQSLDLHAVPRNQAAPDGSANYSLEQSGDHRLTEWMRAHLQIAIWVKTGEALLRPLEKAVIAELRPPLNLAGMGRHADPRVKQARADMVRESRAWRPEQV